LEQSFFVEYFKPDRQERAILIAMSPASNDCTCMGTCAIAEVASALNLAPNNGMFQLVSQTQPCSANPVNAFTLDYSQLLYNGGTQSTQAHIMQRHGNTGLPGVSQYFGNFSQIQNINAATYLFGNQALQGTSVAFQYTFPQPLAPVATMHLGTDAAEISWTDGTGTL
jgi:hypothetical protein